MTFKFDLVTLFELIEARPCLWNKNSDDFKSKILRERTWQEVFTVLDETYEEQSKDEKEITGLMIMTKWANIRDAFIRSLKTKSGQSAKKKYLYAEHLQFLLPMQEHNETDSFIICAEDNSIESNGQENQASSPILNSKSNSSVKNMKRVKRLKRDLDNIEKEILDNLKCTEPDHTCNREENFFTSFLPYVSDMTETEKIELHMDILKSIKNIKQGRYQPSLHMKPLITANQCTFPLHNATHNSSVSNDIQIKRSP